MDKSRRENNSCSQASSSSACNLELATRWHAAEKNHPKSLKKSSKKLSSLFCVQLFRSKIITKPLMGKVDREVADQISLTMQNVEMLLHLPRRIAHGTNPKHDMRNQKTEKNWSWEWNTTTLQHANFMTTKTTKTMMRVLNITIEICDLFADRSCL